MSIRDHYTRVAFLKKANELEDILAGLMINGVRRDEIEVQEHPDRTVVVVRGQPRYEVKVSFSFREAMLYVTYQPTRRKGRA